MISWSVASFLAWLRSMWMNSKPGVDAGSRRLHAWTVVEVDVHLDAELGPVVVDHVAHVGQTDRGDLAVTDLDQHG